MNALWIRFIWWLMPDDYRFHLSLRLRFAAARWSERGEDETARQIYAMIPK